jgi:hypothetical protein
VCHALFLPDDLTAPNLPRRKLRARPQDAIQFLGADCFFAKQRIDRINTKRTQRHLSASTASAILLGLSHIYA